MDNMPEIRPLTREEQLEWLIPFLKEQIKALQIELLIAEEELLSYKIDKQEDKTVGNSL